VERKALFCNFSEALSYWAQNVPDKVYIKDITTNKIYTYSKFNKLVNSAVRFLQEQGVQKGDVVTICIKNSCECVLLYFAAIRIGGIVNPMPNSLTDQELIKHNNFASPKIIFVDKERDELKEKCKTYLVDFSGFMDSLSSYSDEKIEISLEDDDYVCMYYSSGTTSDPKGIMYKRKYHTWMIENVCNTFKFTQDTNHLGILPMGHTAIINYSMLPAAYLGGTMIFSENFLKIRTEFWKVIEEYGIEYVEVVPTVLMSVLNTKYPDFSKDKIRLKYVACGSAPLPLDVQTNFQHLFKTPVCNLYGLSETGPINYDDPLDGKWRPGSVGFPINHLQCKIVDDDFNELPIKEVGEVVVKGEHPFAGYYKNEEATKKILREDGFLLTGDLAYKDEDGRYYYVDRKKDLIIKAGSNIYPGEIDEVLFQHPAVKASSTIGVPDKILGEDIVSFVVKSEEVSERDLVSFCSKKLQLMKCPRRVIFVDSIPQTASGKLLRKELRRIYEEKYGVKKDKKHIVIYGAGAIGRGFLAPIFNKYGYDLSFVDADRELIEKLKRRGFYETAFTNNDDYIFTKVNVKGAYHVEEDQEVIEKADYVFVSVGPRNAVDVAKRLSKAKMIFSFENERNSAKKIKEISGVEKTYFGIPDVIASCTAPKKLLDKDPLCVCCEDGELIVEKGEFEFPGEIKVLGEKELDMHWVCKFYLHNTLHAIISYLGAEKGAKYIHESMAMDDVVKVVEGALESIKGMIVKKGLVTREVAEWYAKREIVRFKNDLLFDPISRVAREPMRKLRNHDRLISVYHMVKEEGIDTTPIYAGIVSAFKYDDEELKEALRQKGVEGVLRDTCGLSPESELYKNVMNEKVEEKGYLDIALRAVKEAGRVAKRDFEKGAEIVGNKESFRDIVTKTDMEIENLIKSVLKSNFPDHGFIGEETGETSGEYRWIIDPIDGTVNFSNGIPLFGISVALAHHNEIILGIVYNPVLNEMYYAEKGKGTKLNGKSIRVSDTSELSKGTFTVTFPGSGNTQESYDAFREMSEKSRGVLRLGSASIKLAYVASGKLAGSWSRKQPVWDVAAGIILVKEAGGRVSTINGGEYKFNESVLVTNGKVHEEAVGVLGKFL